MSLGFVGALLGTSLSAFFMDITFIDWGWKIPYILASLMGVAILIARRCLIETTPWLEEKKSTSRVPFFRCVKEYPREVTVVLLFGMATLMPFYLGVSWVGGYLKTHFMLTSSAILETTSYLMIVAGLSVFLFFWIEVYIRPYILLLCGVLMTFILGGMIYISLHTESLYLLTCTQFMIAIQTGLLTAPVMLLSQGFFPTKFRFSGISIPFSTGQALMTGTTPLFAEMIVQASGYNEAVCLIIFLSGIFLGASAYLTYKLGHTTQL